LRVIIGNLPKVYLFTPLPDPLQQGERGIKGENFWQSRWFLGPFTGGTGQKISLNF
jgi:hypothetical protein